MPQPSRETENDVAFFAKQVLAQQAHAINIKALWLIKIADVHTFYRTTIVFVISSGNRAI